MRARAFEREVELFRQHGGSLRMSEALRLGINPKTLYAMRDASVIEPVARGQYRLASLEPLARPDLVTVAARVPKTMRARRSGRFRSCLTEARPDGPAAALLGNWPRHRRGPIENRCNFTTLRARSQLPIGHRRVRGH
ncbi:type IV toxin-antitoxin system AbiEi family antitoxin domain-containing protein [Vulgatibacter incomptus]|uniref:type IV toxin-antitoxin system AbiEi family antitoxin domain-containing protein n=1 Tax=Vulgatibacter incomptus TaxID=1391653 RepID=UPI001969C8E3